MFSVNIWMSLTSIFLHKVPPLVKADDWILFFLITSVSQIYHLYYLPVIYFLFDLWTNFGQSSWITKCPTLPSKIRLIPLVVSNTHDFFFGGGRKYSKDSVGMFLKMERSQNRNDKVHDVYWGVNLLSWPGLWFDS